MLCLVNILVFLQERKQIKSEIEIQFKMKHVCMSYISCFHIWLVIKFQQLSVQVFILFTGCPVEFLLNKNNDYLITETSIYMIFYK